MALAALAVVCPARATYVQSGKSDFATAADSVCSPNDGSGSVTAGHAIIMGVQANSVTAVSISSTRVSSWTLIGPQSQAAGTVLTYYWWGFADTSGVETITAHFSSGTALIGSACVELTSTVFDNGNSINGTGGLGLTITTAHGPDDVVVFATSGAGGAGSGLTDRQFVVFTATNFAAMGTGTFASAGANLVSTTATGTSTALGAAFYSFGSARRHKAQVIGYRVGTRRRRPANSYSFRHDPVIFVRFPSGRERGQLVAL